MFRHRRILALPVALLTAAAAPLAAQGASPPACDVEQMSPQPLAMASIGRGKVLNAKTPDEGIKAVRDAFKNVYEKETAKNVLGRDYLAAQFMLLAVEYGGETQTRGNLNMPGDKAAQVDLIVAADSLLTAIETAKPACQEEISQWREYKPYANRIKSAYDALGEKKLEEAEASAKRAMILSKNAPQAYDVLWRIAAEKNDEDNQIKYLNIAVDKLGSDTANAKVRSNLMFNLGRIQQGFAEQAAEPRKTQMYKGSAEAYLQVIREYPSSEEAPFAINGISVAWALTKDSTSSLAALEAMKPVIGQLSDLALAQAGVMAVRLQRGSDAAALFKAATEANPYQREYLYNYAATLFDLKRSQEMIPIVGRLLAVDPTNPDNVLLYAYAYKGLADVTTDAAMQKAYNDSSATYITKSDAMKTKVSFTGFDRGRESTQLQGEVENRDRAAKSYTIDFEFVDKTGTVVEKKSVTVGPVAPNANAAFNVEISKGGVAGVRYAPLP